MFTPATRASSTSDPWTIIPNAFWTPVTSPPFLKTLPLAEEMTTGLALFGAITAGACPSRARGAAAVSPAAAPARMKSRRFSFSIIGGSPGSVVVARALYAGSIQRSIGRFQGSVGDFDDPLEESNGP